MGLFGYNQKKYDKNTQIFKDTIDDMLNRCPNQLGIGKQLNAILFVLDETPIQKRNWKNLEAIDARIDNILNTMQRDIQQGKPAMFSAHANMLLSAIKDSRLYGEERCSAKELEAEQALFESRALIRDALVERENIINKKKAIEDKAMNVEKDSPEFASLTQDYSELNQDLKAIDSQVAVFKNRHDANLKIIGTRKIGAAYKMLPAQIVSLKDFDREVEEINDAAAKEAYYTSEISNIAEQFEKEHSQTVSASVDDSLSSVIDLKKQAAMANDIVSADVSASHKTEYGSLEDKLKK